MSKNIIKLCLTLLFFTVSCEQTVENPELPYEEQLVVSCLLEAGKDIQNIIITRTLPPLDEYDIEKALIKDADAVIKSGDKTYPLEFDGKYSYFTDSLIPESGEKYLLEVKWKNLTASAVTTVPEAVDIDSFYYKIEKKEYDWGWIEWECVLFAEFIPQSAAVYSAAVYSIYDKYKIYSEYAYRMQDTLESGKISMPVYQTSSNDTNQIKYELQQYDCILEAYDKPFYNYFLTRYRGNSDNDIFGTSGTNVRGNINGGIGLFIGMASTEKKIEIE